MKIIHHSHLHFQQGKSDKVYEVDLVMLTSPKPKKYLVNFRYGRAGTNLREGSKTASPVTLDKAEAVFNSVVISKINKGYQLKSGYNPLQEADDHSTDNTQTASSETRLEELQHKTLEDFRKNRQ